MAKYERKFNLEVLTPDGTSYKGDSVNLVLPAADGQIGILAQRAPLLAMISAGMLTTEDDQGNVHRFFVAGGFAHVRGDAVSILADECMELSELDPVQATLDLEKIGQLPTDTPDAATRRAQALQVARTKLRLARQGAP